VEIINSKIDNVITNCNKFASEHCDILAILLVGSYARNTQKESSDIDLHDWLLVFGKPLSITTEDYGLITSLRVQYEKYEIEFGLGSTEWISEPIDPGTKKVLADGYKILFERNYILKNIIGSIKPSQS